MMTVAASSTDRSLVAQLRLGDGKIFSGASLFSALVKGKIVICVRGGDISIVGIGEVLKAAGGAGMILANDETQGEDTDAVAHVLPAIWLGASAAKAVISYTKSSKNPTARIESAREVYGNRAPVMAAFSSRGPNSVDPNILKPDVTAPGVNILAAWPTNVSPTKLKSDKRRVTFNVLSGTSMACPHVSGLIALLKSLHRDWSPAAIKSALMTTAYVKDSKNNSESATPFEYGSGHVDPERASDPGLIYDISTQDYLDYLCSLKYNSSQVTLVASKNITCPAASHFRPGDLNYPSFSVIFSRKFTGTTYKRAVTNVGIAVSTYSVKVIEPEGVSITVQPKVLKFRKMREKLSYNVTFKVQKGKGVMPAGFSFGSLEWVSACNKYSVRSPIAVTWTK
ncbi:subtilisin-like protease [Phtheirospermum japonicum]|uniref:Subtilisin-like protease n=1 Tax=Phtheirospermum japonicum TaxID=374723 RepID=A0A830CJW8_9LAMI|nr:subtilisin-like protease [Phtheirospermum japonicum]